MAVSFRIHDSSMILAFQAAYVPLKLFRKERGIPDIHKQTNSVTLSPRTNYTDGATAACRRS
jgi:hypothetical protein